MSLSQSQTEPGAFRRWSKCERKFPYYQRDNAVQAINQMVRQKRATKGELSPYRCSYCLKWHIGGCKGKGNRNV